MALGEWLSVNTARESAQRQIATEADELEQVPEEEKEELSLIYQAKGLPEDLAKSLAEQLIANKKTALDTLVREELGIDPEELGGSAWAAAGTSFLLFCGRCDFSGGAVFRVGGDAGDDRQLGGERGGSVPDRGRHDVVHRTRGSAFRNASAAGGFRRRRRDLWGRQADRGRGHQLTCGCGQETPPGRAGAAVPAARSRVNGFHRPARPSILK